MPVDVDRVVSELRAEAVPTSLVGMGRYGIKTADALGVSLPKLRALAKRVGKDHGLAIALWNTGIHEARMLAALVDVPSEVTERQMDRWARELDSWDVCDCCCSNLFDRTSYAYVKAIQWSGEEPEFVKRAGFALMAALAVHDKKEHDERFVGFLAAIRGGATDDRNYVRKAVNWALRQIGKRSLRLNEDCVRLAREIQKSDSRSAKWIASDALRELTSTEVQDRLKKRARGSDRRRKRDS